MVVAAMAWVYGIPRPRIVRPRGRQAALAVVGGILLLIPILGAIFKGIVGVILFFSPHADLWGGDFFTFFSPNAFVGTGAGVVGGLAVLAVAALAASRLLRRREALALGAVLVACIALHVRLRLSVRGNYMDFKHLGYVGAFVLAF